MLFFIFKNKLLLTDHYGPRLSNIKKMTMLSKFYLKSKKK